MSFLSPSKLTEYSVGAIQLHAYALTKTGMNQNNHTSVLNNMWSESDRCKNEFPRYKSTFPNVQSCHVSQEIMLQTEISVGELVFFFFFTKHKKTVFLIFHF